MKSIRLPRIALPRSSWSSLSRPMKIRVAIYAACLLGGIIGLVMTFHGNGDQRIATPNQTDEVVVNAPASLKDETAVTEMSAVEVTGLRLTPDERRHLAQGGESLEVDPSPPVDLPSMTEVRQGLEEVSAVDQAGTGAVAALTGATPRLPSAEQLGGLRRVGEVVPSPESIVEAKTEKEPEAPPVSYQSGGRRDPFRSLLERTDDDSPLLDLGGARLVGVAWDADERLAMLEDHKGRSFALRAGDKVRSGRLANVTRTKAIFDLWHYGRTERYVLELSRKEGD